MSHSHCSCRLILRAGKHAVQVSLWLLLVTVVNYLVANRYFWGPRIWNWSWLPRRTLNPPASALITGDLPGSPQAHKLAERLNMFGDDLYCSLVSEWRDPLLQPYADGSTISPGIFLLSMATDAHYSPTTFS